MIELRRAHGVADSMSRRLPHARIDYWVAVGAPKPLKGQPLQMPKPLALV